MRYSISSISNRDLQLLYQYRILRQPADFLQAVYTATDPIELTFGEGEEITEDEKTLYRFTTEVATPEAKIPLLEFVFIDDVWAEVQFLTELEVESGSLVLYSELDTIEHLQIKLHWVDSLQEISSILAAYKDELNALRQQLEELENSIQNIDPSGNYLRRPTGVVDNLVKFSDASGRLELADSDYMISSAVPATQLTNPTAVSLAQMIKDINGAITIHCTDKEARTLQNWYGSGSVIITGNGTWYLINVSLPVEIVNFSGSVYVYDCTDITIGKNCNVDNVYAINSIITVKSGNVDILHLHRCSFCKQVSGVIRELAFVGAGCEYYSQVRGAHPDKQEPRFEWTNIQGTVCLSNGQILMNGKDISFVTGHHDDPLQPTKMTIVAEGDVGKEEADDDQDPDPKPEGDRTPIAGNTPEIKVYNWLLTNTTLSKPAICGALGNIKQESGFDPFVTGGTFYGLWQTNRQGLKDAMSIAGLSSYWHSAPAWSDWTGHVTEAEWDEAIDINLSLLVSTKYNSEGFSNYSYDRCLDKPTHREGEDGAAAYAELFAAMVERCVYGNDAIQDPGVADFIKNKIYNGTSYLYQQLVNRRTYARNAYQAFVGD